MRRAVYNFVPRTHRKLKLPFIEEDIKPRALKNVAPAVLPFSYKKQKIAWMNPKIAPGRFFDKLPYYRKLSVIRPPFGSI